MVHLEDRLNQTYMNEHVNVVIVSDHGMTYGHHSPYEVEIKKVKLSNHLQKGTYRYGLQDVLSEQQLGFM